MGINLEPNPEVVIAGVQGTVAVIRAGEGIPVVAIDEAGNVGISGCFLTESDLALARATRS